jgi:hypothetical protein
MQRSKRIKNSRDRKIRQKPKDQQKNKKSFLKYISLGWKIFGVLVFLLSCYISISYFYPKIFLSYSSYNINPNNPFNTPFVLNNIGNTGVNITQHSYNTIQVIFDGPDPESHAELTTILLHTIMIHQIFYKQIKALPFFAIFQEYLNKQLLQ